MATTIDLSQDRKMVNMSDSKNTSASGAGGFGAPNSLPTGGSSNNVGSNNNMAAGGAVLSMVTETATRGLAEVKSFMEQNPSQVRATVFLLACITSVYCGLGLFNVFSTLTSPIEYMVNCYLFIFSCVTIVLEGKSEWPGFSRIQEKVFYQAHFLSTVTGRGVFYLFQGTFGMARLDVDMLMFLCGVGYFAIGTLVIMQSWRASRQEGREMLREQFVPAP